MFNDLCSVFYFRSLAWFRDTPHPHGWPRTSVRSLCFLTWLLEDDLVDLDDLSGYVKGFVGGDEEMGI